MTQEELTKLLMESYKRGQSDMIKSCHETISIAVHTAILAERETCANIAENWNSNGFPRTGVAAQIRARGQA
jgi:aspartokinase